MSLAELCEKGWVIVEPPARTDTASVVARYDGEPIKAGFRTDTIADTESEVHYRYRTGQYDVDVKIDFDIGKGQVKVERAQGYSN
jgi:hypothetical protein